MARKALSGPASDPELLILSSLAEGPKHGYAMMTDIDEFSGGRMGPGTLYTAITRMVEKGWIAPEGPAGRQRPYRLTAVGAAYLEEQLKNMQRVARIGLGEAETGMTIKTRLAAALVRLYPARWRQEYGAEFAAVLAQREWTAATIPDVLWSALRQQVRLGEPWVLAGTLLLLFNLYQFTVLILYPPPYQGDFFAVRPVPNALGVLLLIAVGAWTVIRGGGTAWRAARAVCKMVLLANSPLCLMAILAATGVLHILAVGPGDPVTTFHEHGFAITIYDHMRQPPALFGLFLIPFLSAVDGLMWGWAGAALAPRIGRLLHR